MSARGRAALAGAALLVVLSATAVLRSRLLAMPLERDEGEYAYAGQLLLRGVAPYLEMYNMKLPGIYACYALVLAAFGETTTGVHLGLLVVNAIAILLVFGLGRALAGGLAGVAAAGFFAVLAVSPAVQGTQANAEHFVLLPVLGAALLLSPRPEAPGRRPIALAGLLLGLGFLIKQHAAAFIVWGALVLAVRPGSGRTRVNRLLALAGGAALPYCAIAFAYLALGHFGELWFWTVTYAGHYVSMQSLSDGLAELRPRLATIGGGAWPIAALAALGLVLSAAAAATRRVGLFLAGFAVFSAAAVAPGLYFRPHYFVLTLPALAMAAGIGVAAVASPAGAPHAPGNGAERWRRAGATALACALALAAAGHCLARDRKFLFRMTPLQATRRLYASEPFPEAEEAGRFLRASTAEDERVAVIGSEPEIYFHARRRAATGFVYMYPLVEPQPFASAMQRRLMAEVEAARPRFLVYVGSPYSWDLRPGSDRTVLRWFEAYAEARYRIVGRVDLDGTTPPRFDWGPGLAPGPGPQMLVLERLAP